MDNICPSRMPTRDHAHPRSKGGRLIVIACWTCNHMKGDMTMEEWEAFMALHPRWWNGVSKRKRKMFAQRVPSGQLALIPYAESIMILRHGKDYWRNWKAGGKPVCECCRRPPLPKAYDDPKAQAAFEAVYKNRLHMLRSPMPQT